MSGLYLISLALKVGMLIDALHRRAPFWWAIVIVLVPAGELAYFGFVVLPELLPLRLRARRAKPIPLDQVRYRCAQNPCHDNRVILAWRLLEEGELDESLDAWHGLIETTPDDNSALWGLGSCLLALGRADEAVAPLERIVDRRRSFEDYAAWRTCIEALSAAGRHADSLASAGRLAQAAPRLMHQVVLAQAQQNAGQPEEACHTLEAALEDYKHAPRFIRREAKGSAREANRLLGQLQAA